MTWNYRVIEFLFDQSGVQLETPHYSIHEVYYDNLGIPYAYIADASGVRWDADDTNAPGWILDRFREALEKPVLDVRIFEK